MDTRLGQIGMWISACGGLRFRRRPHPGERLGQRTGKGAVRVPAEPGHLSLGFPKEAGGGLWRQLRGEWNEAGQDGPNGLRVTLCEESHERPPRQRRLDAVYIGRQAPSTIEGRKA